MIGYMQRHQYLLDGPLSTPVNISTPACQVGSNLKNPELPIWVVCSESHFTVLFSPDGRAERGLPPFDLIYYDELANQEVGASVNHWCSGWIDRGQSTLISTG